MAPPMYLLLLHINDAAPTVVRDRCSAHYSGSSGALACIEPVCAGPTGRCATRLTAPSSVSCIETATLIFARSPVSLWRGVDREGPGCAGHSCGTPMRSASSCYAIARRQWRGGPLSSRTHSRGVTTFILISAATSVQVARQAWPGPSPPSFARVDVPSIAFREAAIPARRLANTIVRFSRHHRLDIVPQPTTLRRSINANGRRLPRGSKS